MTDHEHTNFRGMRMASVEDETVTFVCADCGAERVMLRCAGTNRDGSRCRAVAISTSATERACRNHRAQVAIAGVLS